MIGAVKESFCNELQSELAALARRHFVNSGCKCREGLNGLLKSYPFLSALGVNQKLVNELLEGLQRAESDKERQVGA